MNTVWLESIMVAAAMAKVEVQIQRGVLEGLHVQVNQSLLQPRTDGSSLGVGLAQENKPLRESLAVLRPAYSKAGHSGYLQEIWQVYEWN